MLEGLEVVGEWPEWHRDAACAEYVEHGDWWFPDRGESTKPAKEVCQRCLVQSECLGFALDEPLTLAGIWGATSQRERKALKAAGVTGELVRTYGMHAIAGRTAERDQGSHGPRSTRSSASWSRGLSERPYASVGPLHSTEQESDRCSCGTSIYRRFGRRTQLLIPLIAVGFAFVWAVTEITLRAIF